MGIIYDRKDFRRFGDFQGVQINKLFDKIIKETKKRGHDISVIHRKYGGMILIIKINEKKVIEYVEHTRSTEHKRTDSIA